MTADPDPRRFSAALAILRDPAVRLVWDDRRQLMALRSVPARSECGVVIPGHVVPMRLFSGKGPVES